RVLGRGPRHAHRRLAPAAGAGGVVTALLLERVAQHARERVSRREADAVDLVRELVAEDHAAVLGDRGAGFADFTAAAAGAFEAAGKADHDRRAVDDLQERDVV